PVSHGLYVGLYKAPGTPSLWRSLSLYLCGFCNKPTSCLLPLCPVLQFFTPHQLQCSKHWLQLQDKCLTIYSSSKTWNDSLADCSQGESSLLLIQDQEELRFIQNLIKNEGNLYCIGLNFTLSEKKWKWINGSLLNHDILKIFGENKENSCAAISKIKVFSENCNSENKWICEKKLKPVRNKVS
uniref:C-type lectin domain-containing protein n=1 Tax=Marmota marmota marmota TaxID=9994 RepID=A0A8C6A6M8_MARMA